MKNSYLWSQSVSVYDKDYCIINNLLSSYEGTISQDDAMRIINSSQFKLIASHQENDKTSPAFKFKRWGKWIYISGNYHEEDCAGRKRLYIFVTELTDYKSIVQKLEEYASLMNCTLRKEDMQSVRNILSRKKTITILILIITVICLIIICLKSFM